MPAVCIVRQTGSYELHLRREAEAYRDAGFKVDVLILAGSWDFRAQVVDGVTVRYVPLRRARGGVMRYVFDYGAFFLLAGLRLSWLQLRHRYRLIQVNTMPDFLVLCTVVPRLFGARIAVFMKEPTPELAETIYGRARGRRLLVLCEQTALRYAHWAFTVTDDLKQRYVERGADPARIDVVLNCPKHDNLRSSEEIDLRPRDDGAFELLSHGTIEERYGHDVLLTALARAREQAPHVRLRILGAGTFAEHVRQRIADLGLDDIVAFPGWATHAELVRALATCDAGVVSMRASPYSHLVHTTKMFEYIMFDKPVIASRLRAVGNYFGDNALRFFEPDDPEELAAAIIELASDRGRCDALVQNARALYESSYKWSLQSQVLLARAEQALAHGRTPTTSLSIREGQ